MIKKIKLLLLSITVITMGGCSEDFLETKPTDAISAADALTSSDNLLLVLSGLHRILYSQNGFIPGGSNDRAGEHYFIPMNDAITGNLIHSSRANNLGCQDELQWISHTNAQSATTEHLWYQRYQVIASASAIINKVKSGSLTMDAKLSHIVGQAYAYRAWAYHDLITHYAKGYLIGTPATDPGVPLNLGTTAPYHSGPRATVEDVYKQIKEDINLAIDYLNNGTNPGSGSSLKAHISVNAAYGIKARVALSSGDWSTAASAAAAARNGFTLMTEAQYKTGFNTLSLSEVIWGSNVIATETVFFRAYFYMLSPTFNGSHNRACPKICDKEKYNLLPATDYRRSLFLPMAPNTNGAASNNQGGSYLKDPNYSSTSAAVFSAAKTAIITQYKMTSAHNTHPYMHVKFLQKNPGSIDPDDIIYMRASEMILIEAEAKAMDNDIIGAQNALDILAKTRNPSFNKTVFDTKPKLMTEIKLQRYFELYGEGFSYTDHIRWDQGIDLTNSGAAQVLYQDGFIQAKPSVNPKWVFKIPQKEIDANPYIDEADQNP